jgi:hypothetical protein
MMTLGAGMQEIFRQAIALERYQLRARAMGLSEDVASEILTRNVAIAQRSIRLRFEDALEVAGLECLELAMRPS